MCAADNAPNNGDGGDDDISVGSSVDLSIDSRQSRNNDDFSVNSMNSTFTVNSTFSTRNNSIHSTFTTRNNSVTPNSEIETARKLSKNSEKNQSEIIPDEKPPSSPSKIDVFMPKVGVDDDHISHASSLGIGKNISVYVLYQRSGVFCGKLLLLFQSDHQTAQS
jgi:hypothetical protein